MLLTPDELRDLTGYRRPHDQCAWLRARGWTFAVGADKRPKVSRAHAEAQLGGMARGDARPRLHL
jgi:hypothetical protein